MKICKYALYAQIIDDIGTVRACGWAGYYILGNLRDSTLAEIYSNEAAKRFQQTLIDGTYDYCNEENCPYMANGTLESNMIEIDQIPEYPEYLSFAYDRRCNYHCTCCISRSDKKMDVEIQDKMEAEIKKALPYVKKISANGLGELFVSDSMLKLISEWKPSKIENAEFTIETNGSLFNLKNWDKIKNLGDVNLNVIVTVHSFDEQAYQYLSGTTLKIDNIMNNLKFIKSLREQEKINHLELAIVVQERNFRALPEFVVRCLNEFGADRVRVRRFLPEKAMDENYEWFFDVRNPLHPYHKEYLEVMKHPIFKDPRVFIWTGEHLSNRGELPAKANYRIMKNLLLIEDVGSKIAQTLRENGCNKICLHGITDIGKAVIKVLEGTGVEIAYIYDRNSTLEEWQGFSIKKPVHELLEKENIPIMTTLVARQQEMEDFLRHQGFAGRILNLDEILQKWC